MDWYREFSAVEEIKLDDFKYVKGLDNSEDEKILELLYNKFLPYKEFLQLARSDIRYEKKGFNVSGIKVLDSVYEEEYLKVFVQVLEKNYSIYKKSDGSYMVNQIGSSLIPYAVTFKKMMKAYIM